MPGCSDAMASMHATGMSRLGEAGESSGTTSLVFVGSDVKSAPDIPVVTKPCTIDGMPWIFDAPIQTSGAALKWFIEKMAAEEVAYAKEQDLNIYTYLNELALESKPGPAAYSSSHICWENGHRSGMSMQEVCSLEWAWI